MLGTDRSTSARSTVDTYVIAGIADHLCPWQSCYRTTQLLGGDSRVRPLHQRAHRRRWSTRRATRRRRFQTAAQQPGRPAGVARRRPTKVKGSLVAGLHGLAGRAHRGGAQQRRRRLGSAAFEPIWRRPGHLCPRQLSREHGPRPLDGAPWRPHAARLGPPGRGRSPASRRCCCATASGPASRCCSRFVDALDPDRGVVRFDVPGVGGSPLPRVPYPIATLSSWSWRMMAHGWAHQRFDVLGLSWGGGLAQQLRRPAPPPVRRRRAGRDRHGLADGAGPPAGAGPRC